MKMYMIDNCILNNVSESKKQAQNYYLVMGSLNLDMHIRHLFLPVNV